MRTRRWGRRVNAFLHAPMSSDRRILLNDVLSILPSIPPQLRSLSSWNCLAADEQVALGLILGYEMPGSFVITRRGGCSVGPWVRAGKSSGRCERDSQQNELWALEHALSGLALSLADKATELGGTGNGDQDRNKQ